MSTPTPDAGVFIVVPIELGRELLEEGHVEPLFRKDRDDAALLPALVVAASAAVVTVVTTDLSYAARKAIAQKISAWFDRKRNDDSETPELKSQRTGSKMTRSISISRTVTVEAIETIVSEEIASLGHPDESNDSTAPAK